MPDTEEATSSSSKLKWSLLLKVCHVTNRTSVLTLPSISLPPNSPPFFSNPTLLIGGANTTDIIQHGKCFDCGPKRRPTARSHSGHRSGQPRVCFVKRMPAGGSRCISPPSWRRRWRWSSASLTGGRGPCRKETAADNFLCILLSKMGRRWRWSDASLQSGTRPPGKG